MDFIKADSNCFTLNGRRLDLRGLGIGTWLNLEHFMVGLPTPDEMIRTAFQNTYGPAVSECFFKKYVNSFINDADFAFLKKCGINFLRIPFNYRLFIDDNRPGTFREYGFTCFDKLFRLGRKYGIYIMPDLHTAPGGQNPDWHSDNSIGVPLFWKYQLFRKQMSELWGVIASRYSDEPALMGYDLLNEPAMADWSSLNEFYGDAIAAIRRSDGRHLIILEGDRFSMDFSGLKKFDDPGLALGFHFYPGVWHPEILRAASGRRDLIAAELDPLLDSLKCFDMPVLCGEFGYGKDSGSDSEIHDLLSVTLDLFSERKLSWTLWCYKDAHFMSLIYPQNSSHWMQLYNDIGNNWSQDIEKEQASKILDYVRMQWFPEMKHEDEYLLQFRIRAILYHLQKKYILEKALTNVPACRIIDYPDDFRFENCKIDTAMKKIIADHI